MKECCWTWELTQPIQVELSFQSIFGGNKKKNQLVGKSKMTKSQVFNMTLYKYHLDTKSEIP